MAPCKAHKVNLKDYLCAFIQYDTKDQAPHESTTVQQGASCVGSCLKLHECVMTVRLSCVPVWPQIRELINKEAFVLQSMHTPQQQPYLYY